MEKTSNGGHYSVMTWASLIGAALAIGTVVFTAGDASQRLDNAVSMQRSLELRTTKIENAQSDMRVTLATLAAQMSDVQETVHRVDRSPVPRTR